MASVRHKHAIHRPLHKRIIRLVLPAAGVVGLVAASLALAFHDSGPTDSPPSATASMRVADSSDLASRTSRDDVRPPLPDEDEQHVTGHRYTITALDMHAGPSQNAPVLLEIEKGKKVDVTGKTDGKWAEIVHKGTSRWVTGKFLKTKAQLKVVKAKAKADKPLGGAPCATGSEMEAGLQPDTIRVHRAVCSQFPEIKTYLGLGGGGEHASGQAVDIMLGSSTGSGDAIAAYAMKHASALGVSQVIYRQRIWTTQRSSEGWRPMPDRGSPTANHMDHVHVTTNGSSGTS